MVRPLTIERMTMFKYILKYIQNFMWALTLAYMMAWHNVYYEDMKFPDEMTITLEQDEVTEDSSKK